MKLDGQRESDNVEDRRGSGGGGVRRGGVALSGGTIVLVLVVSAITGQNPLSLLGQIAGSGGGMADSAPAAPVNPNDPAAVFSRKILATTEEVWNAQFAKLGKRYTEPHLVLFRGAVDTACGEASSAVGPFYCPGDTQAYLDLDFFDELSRKFGAPGDFAAAYVIAHEIGHHVQNITGVNDAHRDEQQKGATGASVKMELQADCYAGVWGAFAKQKGLLDAGDLEEALRAANAIGDDTLQKRGSGHVSPESFSHGSSAQRMRWFKAGMDAGDMRVCDTFGTANL